MRCEREVLRWWILIIAVPRHWAEGFDSSRKHRQVVHAASEVRRQRQAKCPRSTQEQLSDDISALPVIGIENVLDIEARDQQLALGARILEGISRAEIETRPFREAAPREG